MKPITGTVPYNTLALIKPEAFLEPSILSLKKLVRGFYQKRSTIQLLTLLAGIEFTVFHSTKYRKMIEEAL
jgi:hypothetical protein